MVTNVDDMEVSEAEGEGQPAERDTPEVRAGSGSCEEVDTALVRAGRVQ